MEPKYDESYVNDAYKTKLRKKLKSSQEINLRRQSAKSIIINGGFQPKLNSLVCKNSTSGNLLQSINSSIGHVN